MPAVVGPREPQVPSRDRAGAAVLRTALVAGVLVAGVLAGVLVVLSVADVTAAAGLRALPALLAALACGAAATRPGRSVGV